MSESSGREEYQPPVRVSSEQGKCPSCGGPQKVYNTWWHKGIRIGLIQQIRCENPKCPEPEWVESINL